MPLRACARPAALRPLFFLLALAVLPACDDLGADPGARGIPAVLAADPDFSQLHALVEASALAGTLSGGGPYTLFAPDDVAFLYLGGDTRGLLLRDENADLLDRVLRHHVVPGRVEADDLTDGAVLETLAGVPLVVRREGETVFVGEARITDDPVAAENGLVYPVSSVIRSSLTLVERLRLTPSAADFVTLLDRTGDLGGLGAGAPVTVFAAIDDAFDQFGSPALSLLYDPVNADVPSAIAGSHLVDGAVDLSALPDGATLETREGLVLRVTQAGGVTYVNGRRVLSPAVATTGGVFYLLDALILDALDLDQHLRINPNLQSFQARASKFPALRALLAGDAPYTVFAFTNGGYLNLPSNVRTALDLPVNAPLLRRVLEVHVVPGAYRRGDLTDGRVLETVEGTPLRVNHVSGLIYVGSRPLTVTSLDAANGVIHYLDGVAFPTVDVFDTAILRGLPDYAQLVRAAGLESTFRTMSTVTLFGFTDAFIDATPNLLSRPDLAAILRYHATAEALPSISDGQVITPLQGPDWTAYLVNVGGTNVIKLDSLVEVGLLAPATNGYVYYASPDTLLTPSQP